MIEEALSTERAQRIYDRIGARYDWFGLFESRARQLALSYLALRRGARVLNLGVGTGQEHAILRQGVGEEGLALGLDVSRVMVLIAAGRSGAPMLQADAMHLPIASGSMDLVYSAYLLDLIPGIAQPQLLEGVRRILKPSGRLVILSLTEGVDPLSRGLVGLWKRLYAFSPALCAGCRPIRLAALVRGAGFEILRSQVVVQLGLPSEVVEAKLSSPFPSWGGAHGG